MNRAMVRSPQPRHRCQTSIHAPLKRGNWRRNGGPSRLYPCPRTTSHRPSPGCVRSPAIDVSPQADRGAACPMRHRLARLAGHLTASRPSFRSHDGHFASDRAQQPAQEAAGPAAGRRIAGAQHGRDGILRRFVVEGHRCAHAAERFLCIPSVADRLPRILGWYGFRNRSLQYRSAKRTHELNAAKVLAELQKELLDKLILLNELVVRPRGLWALRTWLAHEPECTQTGRDG
jgi:hypothetical protein